MYTCIHLTIYIYVCIYQRDITFNSSSNNHYKQREREKERGRGHNGQSTICLFLKDVIMFFFFCFLSCLRKKNNQFLQQVYNICNAKRSVSNASFFFLFLSANTTELLKREKLRILMNWHEDCLTCSLLLNTQSQIEKYLFVRLFLYIYVFQQSV